MSGIYIHIPFCKKACHYCNFHFSTSLDRMPEMIKAIGKEAELRKDYITEKVDTIYFGGGTPSLFTHDEVKYLIKLFRRNFLVDEQAEITLEANPDDISDLGLLAWKRAGINRLSIGIQSFFEEDLVWMNRAHTVTQTIPSIEMAQAVGFHNISIDLIYGTPGLTDEKWKQNIQTALSLHIPHLSCYALTVEPKTALAKMIATEQSSNVDADKQAVHFSILCQQLGTAGYEHYEISNFALPGFRSQHNSSYWKGKPYLGLGPSAHSFNGKSRQWNIANNALYLKAIAKREVPFEIEWLTETQQFNEYIMTALRTMEGISLEKVGADWGEEKTIELNSCAQKYLQNGALQINSNYLRLTESGKFLADGIAADLFQL